MLVRAADKARVGRLRVPTTAEGLLAIAGRGRQLAGPSGCERLVLAMETTGHYWKILARAAERIGIPYVTVQSFVVARARELEGGLESRTRDLAMWSGEGDGIPPDGEREAAEA